MAIAAYASPYQVAPRLPLCPVQSDGATNGTMESTRTTPVSQNSIKDSSERGEVKAMRT